MGWTTPTDRSTGYVVTAADWNIVEDDLAFLYGDTSWTAVTYQNSWVDFGGGYQAVQYRKIGTRVMLRGAAKSGTVGTTVFTLPTGYRPAASLVFAVVSNNAFGAATITNTGTVTASIGSNASFVFDGILFDTI